ncbi:DNA primase [Candidatus Woesearchaeota archaeon]|nr:DNA primase [Candidatus Woesearchaeota archaeon]
MGKISPVSSKYIVNASIEIDGVVDRPDVIGAIFGQTEGLLGSELELRELQRSGRIGRIEVNVDTRGGKTQGAIIIPSSLDKAETAIVGAALEIIQRIGPCNAKIKVTNVEDVRVTKRSFVIERAKELLKNLMETTMPDSQEIADEVAQSVRIMEVVEYGKDRLPAGPCIDESEDIVIVEGRADVLNLLKNGFKNVIALNGMSCPQTVIDLCQKKEVTLFVDGDRGGSLIVRDLLALGEIDFVTRAPDGKEVEELAKKEIHKALRSKITAEQAKLEMASNDTSNSIRKPVIMKRPVVMPATVAVRPATTTVSSTTPIKTMPVAKPIVSTKKTLTQEEHMKFGEMLENLIGTRGAYLLDDKHNVLGKVPFTELATTLKSLNAGVYAVIFDGITEPALVEIAERSGISHIIAMDTKVPNTQAKVNIVTANEL